MLLFVLQPHLVREQKLPIPDISLSGSFQIGFVVDQSQKAKSGTLINADHESHRALRVYL